MAKKKNQQILDKDLSEHSYEDVKDSLLDFLETAYLTDIQIEGIPAIVSKTNKAIDNFANYVLKTKPKIKE